jgi:hypothetical protein
MSEYNNSLVCTLHPNRETQLRCNRCDRPICIKCANHTPTGYRCPECIRSQQKIFVTTKRFDQVIAGVITAVISYLGSLFTFLGFISILIALGTGFAAVWVVKKAIQNRRSPLLKYVMSGTALIISMVLVPLSVFQQIQVYGFVLNYYSIIWKLAYAVIISGNIFYRLKN